jgi:hypothetical protein
MSFTLSLFRNESKTGTIQVLQADRTTPQDVTGWTAFWFTAKANLTDADTEALFQLTLDAGLTVTDAVRMDCSRSRLRRTITTVRRGHSVV